MNNLTIFESKNFIRKVESTGVSTRCHETYLSVVDGAGACGCGLGVMALANCPERRGRKGGRWSERDVGEKRGETEEGRG